MKIFETYVCWGKNLSNFLCQFWNDELIPLQISYPTSISWKAIPLYFLSPNNIYFAPQFFSKFFIRLQFNEILRTFLAQTIYTLLIRSPLKWKSFGLSRALVKICQIPYANFETRSRLISKFLFLFQFHERLLLCTFWAQTIYTLPKEGPLKWKFLRLLSAQVKICQISYVNFETASPFLSKFCIPLQFKEILCTFLAQRIYTWVKRSPLKLKVLRLSSARFKFCQIPYANFETTSRFCSKFYIPFHFHVI